MDAHDRRLLTKAGLGAAPPLLLALLEWFHPHAHDLLDLDIGTWLFVHYAQIPLFPLAALAVAALLHGHRDMTALASRVALFVFAVSYVAFDTAAGVVTGILVQAARASGDPEAWRGAIDTVWLHPIVGGLRQSNIPSLSSVGAAALGIGTVAAAVSLRRAGRPWPPVVLLALSGFGLEVFNTHAWPGGPLTFGGIAAASAWIQWSAAQAMARHRELLAIHANHDRHANWRPVRTHSASGARHGKYP